MTMHQTCSVLLMLKANDGGKVAKCDVVATVDLDVDPSTWRNQ